MGVWGRRIEAWEPAIASSSNSAKLRILNPSGTRWLASRKTIYMRRFTRIRRVGCAKGGLKRCTWVWAFPRIGGDDHSAPSGFGLGKFCAANGQAACIPEAKPGLLPGLRNGLAMGIWLGCPGWISGLPILAALGNVAATETPMACFANLCRRKRICPASAKRNPMSLSNCPTYAPANPGLENYLGSSQGFRTIHFFYSMGKSMADNWE